MNDNTINSNTVNQNNKLNIKDFMTVGIFTAISLVISIIIAFSIGFIPIFYMMLSAIMAFVNGIPMMLFYTKVKKFGMILAYTVIFGLLALLMGKGPYGLLLGIVFGLLGEVIVRSGRYESSIRSVLSYAVISMVNISNYFTMFFASKAYIESIRENFGEGFIAISEFCATNQWLIVAIFVATFLSGVLGGVVGRKTLKKHFERGGVI